MNPLWGELFVFRGRLVVACRWPRPAPSQLIIKCDPRTEYEKRLKPARAQATTNNKEN